MSASHTEFPALDPVLAGVYRRGYTIRRRRLAGRLAAGAVALQLVVALPMAMRQGDDAGGARVRLVAPATEHVDPPATTEVPVVASDESPSTTTAAPVVVPATTTPARLGVVFGVIGAGEGGRGSADLNDDRGNKWHVETDPNGNYRFEAIPAAHYTLYLTAESAAAPCTPEGTCIGTAMAISKDEFDLAPGEEHRTDFPMYGPTSPAGSTTTTAPATTTTSVQ